MASVNKVTLLGNLGADPEIKRSTQGNPIATFRMATSESWKDKNTGEKQERTEWHSVVVFNEGLCKIVEQYLRKGSKVYVEGQMQTRKWQDQEGKDRYTTEVVLRPYRGEIVLLDGKGKGIDESSYGVNRGGGGAKASPIDDLDDEIPF